MKELEQYEKVYAKESKVQLSFGSYMKLLSLMHLLVSVSGVAVFIFSEKLIISSGSDQGSLFAAWALFWSFLGFYIFLMVSSIISYPIYRFICEKKKGVFLSGKFSFLLESSNKSLNQDSR